MTKEQNDKQVKRVKDKISWMRTNFPTLLNLDKPMTYNQMKEFERSQGIDLPDDFRQITTQVADGGCLPSFLTLRSWRGLSMRNKRELNLGVPFPAEQLLSNQSTAWSEIKNLPGQIMLMGDLDVLGWALVCTGAYKGEVWTVGSFGAARVPGCSFAQWLELVLDGNLVEYISYCLTGKEIQVSIFQKLLELLHIKYIWNKEEDPAMKCAQWLDRHRKNVPKKDCLNIQVYQKDMYEYHGEEADGGQFLKYRLVSELRPLPEESGEQLQRMQEVQAHFGRRQKQRQETVSPKELTKKLYQMMDEKRIFWEDSGEMERLRQLCEAVRAGTAIEPDKMEHHEWLLYQVAQELCSKKSFRRLNVGVQDLSFLIGAENLRQLELRSNDVIDLSPLSGLLGLKKLELPNNLISDLSPLAGLEQLSRLILWGNKIVSLEPLRNLKMLKDLDLRGNPLEEGTLSYLRKCKNLDMLSLENTGIRNLKELEFCRAWYLGLYGNPDLTGLEVLPSMKKLSCLYLDTAVAKRYDIIGMMPRFTEWAQLDGICVYVWPEKYYN